jgi:hypothetical protein
LKALSTFFAAERLAFPMCSFVLIQVLKFVEGLFAAVADMVLFTDFLDPLIVSLLIALFEECFVALWAFMGLYSSMATFIMSIQIA